MPQEYRAVAEPQLVPLEEIQVAPSGKPHNLDAYIPGAALEEEPERTFDPSQVRPEKPPGKISTIARWASNVIRGRSWVMNLNVTATNRCTQACPMCNAYVLAQEKRVDLTAEDFALYLEKLAPYRIAACTMCGGEPTIVPDMPEILALAQKHFPFGVMIISNLYGNTRRVMRVMEAALRLGIKVNVSFDGFDEAADKLRGARDVGNHVLRHLRMVVEMKKELKSTSPITLHTVLSDLNVKQYPQILELVQELGIYHSLGPVHSFEYLACNLENPEDFPTFTPGKDLENAVQMALNSGLLAAQSHAFVRGFPAFAARQSPKICPYLTRGLKRMYLFMEPNGDISLCDRQPIGNVRYQTLEEMFAGSRYFQRLEQSIKPCPGCWYSCFVELPLSLKPSNLIRLDFLHQRMPKRQAD